MSPTSILWYLWLLVLGSSLMIDAQLVPDTGGSKVWLRLGSSLLLVCSGVLAARQSTSWKFIAWLVAIGMLFGFLGDAAMANKIHILPDRVLGGMVFFGLGHIAYISALEWTRRRFQLTANTRWWLAIVTWQALGIAIWYVVVFLSENKPALHLPALGYCLLLALTAGMSWGLALQYRGAWMIALGATLFLASDAILAWQLFRNSGPVTHFLVWATYGPGQMFIVYGFQKLWISKTSR